LATVKRYVKLYREKGAQGFFAARRRRSGVVLTAEVKAQAQARLEEGQSVAEVGKGSSRQCCGSSKVQVLVPSITCLPSSQAALRLPGPLRTGRESFPSSGSSPSNASQRETRFRYGHTLTMNPVMALRMK
jgi:hypothetical protein